MSQINSGEVFTTVAPGKTLTAARANNMVNGATLLNGAVLDQVEKVIPVEADTVLLGDSTLAASGIPKKVTLGNLLPETIRQGVPQYGTDGAATDAYVVTLAPLPTALTAGMVVRFKAATANTGGATLSLVTATVPTTAKAILTPAKRVLQTGDILADQLCECVYDGTQFILTSARSLRLGIEEFGTGGGTANVQTVMLSPVVSALTLGMRVRYVATVANTSAMTLTVDGTAATAVKKIVAGAAVALLPNDIQSGDVVTVEYDGTQYQLINRVRSWDYVGTAAIPTGGAVANLAHSLVAKPTKVRAVIVCVTTDQGFAVGDELEAVSIQNDASNTNFYSIFTNATNVVFARRAAGSNMQVVPAAGGALVSLTDAKWNVKAYASL